MPLDPMIEMVRDAYGLNRDDFWELPQKRGTWIIKHAALEVVAMKARIEFDPPMILEANGAEGVAAVCVTGRMETKDRGIISKWSIGEASPKNSKNAYPWAMAEKRAVDRVILKLVGIHGLVYSEDEADDFREPEAPRQLVKVTREVEKELRAEIEACGTEEDLVRLWKSKPFQAEYAKMQKTYQDGLLELFKERKEFLKANPARIPPNFDHLETTNG